MRRTGSHTTRSNGATTYWNKRWMTFVSRLSKKKKKVPSLWWVIFCCCWFQNQTRINWNRKIIGKVGAGNQRQPWCPCRANSCESMSFPLSVHSQTKRRECVHRRLDLNVVFFSDNGGGGRGRGLLCIHDVYCPEISFSFYIFTKGQILLPFGYWTINSKERLSFLSFFKEEKEGKKEKLGQQLTRGDGSMVSVSIRPDIHRARSKEEGEQVWWRRPLSLSFYFHRIHPSSFFPFFFLSS